MEHSKYLEKTHPTTNSSKYLRGFSSEKFSNSRSIVYEKGTIFYQRYAKGVPFLSKMVYKRVRVWTSGRSLPV